jgi:hypothetical protein
MSEMLTELITRMHARTQVNHISWMYVDVQSCHVIWTGRIVGKECACLSLSR